MRKFPIRLYGRKRWSYSQISKNNRSIPSSREILHVKFNDWKATRTKDSTAFVIFMDFDQFKSINELFSFEVGDQLLQLVYHTLNEKSPSNCTWISLGNNSFMALVTGVYEKSDIEALVESWKNSISRSLVVDSYEFNLKPTFGSSKWFNDAHDLQSLMKCADVAHRQAKGKPQSFFEWYDPVYKERIVAAFELESEMHSGIKNGEFELYYHPQWDVDKGGWGGLEVLVRWRHPNKGLIPPDKFIDIAEETGLIHPLGDWIIEKACKNHVVLQRTTGLKDLPIAINFSIKQLMKKNYIEKLVNIIKETGLDPHHFIMEITESVAVDVEKAKSLLSQAREHGMKISIDDFGTGYSSLSYLRELPIDELKIDRSFVKKTDNGDEKQKHLLRWIVHLKKVLGVTIVAEGIETKQHFNMLRRWGCNKLQGYYFSKPISQKEINNYLIKNHANE
ncbi:putative bifunctional diguanylate cyclase/phosphodiesterase [Evansella cellulosilytica]|uniref:Diguanylate cyclase/phosphodiesterase n=1 Tax=Evansella cellulosilytica (strain ATCC 21833 / DSM 2522 / FERM P-1141 / JCM 9156 / N-4) TaxID=649639 RepID=E6TYR7_EVAC2|nr:GGDEF domain-containing phosphodiesterase [Evansella cellulosilytica]ADU31252.1 diguanylate cyclase/phosphodiesterase [Evansella cellulosilytica DSM 2522]